MIIVGERLNSSRPSVLKALSSNDEQFLIQEAKKQEKAGANYIDINTAALLEKEIPSLEWAIPLLQRVLSVPLSIDTPNKEAMEAGLQLHKGQALLNSLTGETKRLKEFLPIIKAFKPKIIILCFDDNGLPKTSDQELAVARNMISLLDKEDINIEDVFIDPLVRPIGVDQQSGKLFLESLEKLKRNFPKIKTIAGISNVSFGLPKRRLLNQTFLTLAIKSGLDAAICDPLDKKILSSIKASEALLGKDLYLKKYLQFIRQNDKKSD